MMVPPPVFRIRMLIASLAATETFAVSLQVLVVNVQSRAVLVLSFNLTVTLIVLPASGGDARLTVKDRKVIGLPGTKLPLVLTIVGVRSLTGLLKRSVPELIE